MSNKINITVLGAGIVGLTTGFLLSKDARFSITIVAKHMPGDYDIEYASPWAGANYLPFSKAGTPNQTYEKVTWPELQRLAATCPEAGIHFQKAVLYNRKKDVGTATGDFTQELLKQDPWYKDTVPDYKVLGKNELPPGIDSGISFGSVCVNTMVYLPWLVSQCLKNGVILKRGVVMHVSDAARLHASGRSADVIVNCTGLSSLTLGGVEDKMLYPLRGQTVVVRDDPGVMIATSGSDDGPDEFSYMMTRAAGGGCVLGGCAQKGSWESQPDPNLAQRIMKRCIDLCPSLTNGKGVESLSIIRHAVGLRPAREGGIRLEKERIKGVWVVHNYGHAGYGYQTSYGVAQAAVALVKEIVQGKPRL